MEVLEKLAKDLGELFSDISRMVDNEKNKLIENEQKDKDKKDKKNSKKPSKEKRLKSLQRLTTFYSSEKEAKEMSEADPIVAFIDKRTKEIFRG